MSTKLTVTINGMHCDGCIAALQASLGGLAGVLRTNTAMGEVEVEYDDTTASRSTIFETIRQSGTFEIAGFSTPGQR